MKEAKPPERFSWNGGDAPCLDGPRVTSVGRVAIGCYAGIATKNEDGAMLWCGEDWVFAVILDGHAGSESVEAVLELFANAEQRLMALCGARHASAIPTLQQELIALLSGPAAATTMAKVRGETACLVCYQAGQHLLWLSIGDNSLYLLHPELARLGQFTLTARNYFEWIGERNSMDTVPAYFSTGVRQLRQGVNAIVLATDGILEMPGTPFEPPHAFSAAYRSQPDPHSAVTWLLAEAQSHGATDSSTLIAWEVNNPHPALMPSG